MLLKYLKTFASLPYRADRVERKIDTLLLLQAQESIRRVRQNDIKNLQDAEFKVFSQWGEDGIIQYLIHKLNIENKTFIEFGVENYRESNTRFLLVNNNWRGLVLDGSAKHIDTIKNDSISWQYDLTAVNAFITKDNINELISQNGFSGDVGILSIDIDGNDYWVWDNLNCVNADIVIAEYNAAFGIDRSISIPYDPAFVTSKAHYSYLYFGASLAAMSHLASKKGYFLVGGTTAGNNAFFVNNKYRHIIDEVKVENAFSSPMSRQSRNEDGKFSFLSFRDSVSLIKGQKVVNVLNGETEHL